MATVPPWPVTNSDSVPSVSNSDGTNESETGADDDGSNDAEGVWSPDIEQSFQEALAIYPPCGRRKIILSDEGKMYGRNELIARYIKLRTGKTRTRKQVSSHIQVLARRKSKDIQTQLKNCPSVSAKERALQSLSAMSSSQIVSVSAMRGSGGPPSSISPPTGLPAAPFSIPPHSHPGTTLPSHHQWPPAASVAPPTASSLHGYYGGLLPGMDVKPTLPLTGILPNHQGPSNPITSSAAATPSSSGAGAVVAWEGRSIAAPKLRLCEFVAFMEKQTTDQTNSGLKKSEPQRHIFVDLGAPPSLSDPPLEVVDIKQIYDKFPTSKGGLQDLYDRGPHGAFFLVKFWADLSADISDDTNSTFYGVNSQYESKEQMSICCSTKVCSFGRQVVEKVETEHAMFENGKYVYRFHRSQMCEYMVTFIHRLKMLPEKYMMNSVLENFTILQVVQNRDTQETLLCIAFVFEVNTSESGTDHSIYKLIKEG